MNKAILITLVAMLTGSGAFASEPERVVVIRTIIMEAIGAGDEALLGVAETIRNRVKDSRWPDAAYEVVIQPWQFSPNNGDREANWSAFKKRAKVDGGDWQRASRAWERSATTNTVDGANHFHSYMRKKTTVGLRREDNLHNKRYSFL